MAIGVIKTTQVTQCALRKGANDHSNEGSSGSTTSTTPVDINTLPPFDGLGDDWLIVGYLSIKVSDTARSATPRLYHDTAATAYNSHTIYVGDTTSYRPWACMQVLTGLSGSQTFKLQIQAETLNTAYYFNNFLAAINLSDFPAYYHSESLAISSTSSTSFVDKISLAPTVVADTAHLLLTHSMYRKNINNGYLENRTLYNDGVMALNIEQPQNFAAFNPHQALRVVRPKTTTPTIKVQHRTQSTANAGIISAKALLIQLNDNAALNLNGPLQLNGNMRIR